MKKEEVFFPFFFPGEFFFFLNISVPLFFLFPPPLSPFSRRLRASPPPLRSHCKVKAAISLRERDRNKKHREKKKGKAKTSSLSPFDDAHHCQKKPTASAMIIPYA